MTIQEPLLTLSPQPWPKTHPAVCGSSGRAYPHCLCSQVWPWHSGLRAGYTGLPSFCWASQSWLRVGPHNQAPGEVSFCDLWPLHSSNWPQQDLTFDGGWASCPQLPDTYRPPQLSSCLRVWLGARAGPRVVEGTWKGRETLHSAWRGADVALGRLPAPTVFPGLTQPCVPHIPEGGWTEGPCEASARGCLACLGVFLAWPGTRPPHPCPEVL